MRALFLFVAIVFSSWGSQSFAVNCVEGKKLSEGCKDLKEAGFFGCCNGKINVFCEHHTKQGVDLLCYKDCSTNSNPLVATCGWNKHFGFYDCFDGGPDPNGVHPMACPACTPQCDGKECGYDGCYGLCGRCGAGKFCDNGKCKPCSCKGRVCGSDQCGHSCGTCDKGKYCTSDGKCVDSSVVPVSCTPHKGPGSGAPAVDKCVCNTVGDWYCCNTRWEKQCVDEAVEFCGLDCPCLPDCTGKNCGPDGCGGSCGDCGGPDKFCKNGMCMSCLDCSTRQCGDNGCGQACGTCHNHQACVDGQCVDPPPYCREKDDKGCGDAPDDCDRNIVDCVCQAKNDHYCCDTAWDWLCVVEYLDCANKVFEKDISCPCVPHCEGRECGPDGCNGSCGQCPDGQICNDQGKCVDAQTLCGNGQCESGEDCATCPMDCGCTDGLVCLDGVCSQPVPEPGDEANGVAEPDAVETMESRAEESEIDVRMNHQNRDVREISKAGDDAAADDEWAAVTDAGTRKRATGGSDCSYGTKPNRFVWLFLVITGLALFVRKRV